MKENLFEAYARMCEFYSNSYCSADCKIGKMLKEKGCQYIYPACVDFLKSNPKEAEEIITKWAEEHPIKTRQDVFLEQYPNAQLNMKGTLMINPCYLDKSIMTDECFKNRDCFTCSKKYWEEEV